MTTAKELIEVDGLVDHTAFEEEPKDLEVGITVQNLTKIYESVSVHHRVCMGRVLLCKAATTFASKLQ